MLGRPICSVIPLIRLTVYYHTPLDILNGKANQKKNNPKKRVSLLTRH